MKDISKVMANIQSCNFEREKPAHQKSEQASQIINELFQQLKRAKPAWGTSFKEGQEENEMKKEWYKAFVENEVNTMAKIKVGMVEARKDPSPFWPSSGQFIKWCNGPDVDTDLAFDLMIKGYKPESAADIYTRRDVAYQCKTQLAEKPARELFKKTYIKYMKLEAEGKIKFKPIVELADKRFEKPRLSKEEVEAERSATRKMMEDNNMPMIGPFRRNKK